MIDKSFVSDSVEWDVHNWSKALNFWEKNVELDNKKLTCLELGSRRGGLSLWLAMKGNYVVCSDLNSPELMASILHKKYSFPGKIEYEAIDATKIPYENHFDIVIFKSILGGIGRNENFNLTGIVLEEIYKSLKPGGVLLFAENLIGSPMHQYFRKKLAQWAGYWNYLRLEDVEKFLTKFESVHYRTAGFLGAFGRTERQRRLLGWIDTILVERIVMKRMKYIVFGTAVKGR
jgi:SAM-dependent methyltransferase